MDYKSLVARINGIAYDCQMMRNTHVSATIRNSFSRTEAPTTEITADNIHEVSVCLVGDFFDYTKDNIKYKVCAFKLNHPFMLPVDLNRDSAKTFFDEIRQKKNFKPEELILS